MTLSKPAEPATHRRIRLAALYSHPIQYAAPLFRELAARPEIDLTVYFCSRLGLDLCYDPQFGLELRWDIPLLEGYRSVFLPNLRRGAAVDGFWKLISPAIVPELMRRRYDALLVHGYEHATKWLAFFAARLSATRLLLRGESHRLRARPWYIDLAKEVILRPLLWQVDECLYLGEHNRRFYRHYGVPDSKLTHVPYTVDNTFFQDSRARYIPERVNIRRQWGIEGDAPVILCVGKLIPEKQPLFLLEAFQQLRQRHACHLVYVGDGELRAQVEAGAARSRTPGVVVTGFLNQTEIGKAYTAGDILVLPSVLEQWGVVIDEAMNFGLPIVASDRVGCVPDLVHQGENGFVFPYDKAQALSEALENLVVDTDLRRSFGQRSLEMIQAFGVQRAADGILRALGVKHA